jgi:hypothetical protein
MAFVRDDVWLQVTSYRGTLGTCVYVYVDDVNALHAELVAKGVQHLDPVQDQTWECASLPSPIPTTTRSGLDRKYDSA